MISKPYYSFAKHVPSKQKITIQDPSGKHLTSSQRGGIYPVPFFGWWFSNPSSHLLNTPCPAAIPWPYSRIKTGSFCGYRHHKRIKETKNRVPLGALLFGCIVFLLYIICASVPTKRTQNPKILLNCCYWLSQMSVFYTLAHAKLLDNRNLCHYIVIIPTNLRSQHE